MKTLHKTLLIMAVVIVLVVVGYITMRQLWTIPHPSGKQKTLTFTLEKLTNLDIQGVFAVNFIQNGGNEIHITADENFFNCIGTSKEGEKFNVFHKRNCIFRTYPNIVVDVFFDQLKSISLWWVSKTISNSGTVNVPIITLKEALQLEVSGTSTATLSLNAPSIHGIVSGVSKLKLAGTTQSLSLDASGVSEIDATALTAEKASVETSGMGKINVNAKEIVSQKSSGLSSIKS